MAGAVGDVLDEPGIRSGIRDDPPDDLDVGRLVGAADVVDLARLAGPGTSCQVEIKKALDDADDYDLTVQRVTVTGSQATALVRRGKDGPTATFRFVREGGAWKATSFGG